MLHMTLTFDLESLIDFNYVSKNDGSMQGLCSAMTQRLIVTELIHRERLFVVVFFFQYNKSWTALTTILC